MEQLRNTTLAAREKEHADEIINYLKDIEANYPGIMFDEPVLAYMGVEYFDGREFFGVFEFNVCGTYSVPDGENLTDSEIRKMIDNIVFEHCEIHLNQMLKPAEVVNEQLDEFINQFLNQKFSKQSQK